MKNKIKRYRLLEEVLSILFLVFEFTFIGFVLLVFINSLLYESSEPNLVLKNLTKNPLFYCLALPSLVAFIGSFICTIIAGSETKSEYYSVIENLLKETPNAVTIEYSVFEGTYSRNPNAWELHDYYVQRVENKAVCNFEWKDYKKYKAMRKAQNNNAELLQVRELKEQFMRTPKQYLEAHNEPIELKFKPAKKEYALLQQDVERYRKRQMYETVMSDYV